MKAKTWMSLVYVGFLLALGVGWLRERQRAEDASLEYARLIRQLEGQAQERSESATQSERLDSEPSPQPSSPTAQNNLISITPNDPSQPAIESLIETPTNQTPVPPIREGTPLSASFTSSDIPLSVETNAYTELQLEIYRCSNQMQEINIATERWAAAHDGIMPNSLAELRGYLAPMLLICPASHPNGLAASWSDFDQRDISYRVRLDERGNRWIFRDPSQAAPPSVHWLFCPIHKTSFPNVIVEGGIPADQVFQPKR